MTAEPMRIAIQFGARATGARAVLADEIRTYGEQCRRAGAEAMREAAAREVWNSVSAEHVESFVEVLQAVEHCIRALPLPLPPATKAADLTTPYRPALINYPDGGDSEFVMFDTGCIYEEAGDYAIIKDMATRTPIGFRWRTKSPPTAPQSSPKAASPAAGWRTDMNAAPKDGRLVDLLSVSRGRLIGCRWSTKTGKEWHWWWPDASGSARRITDATHWMLPPDIPAPSEEAMASPPNTEDARGG